jgi:hypothetical protein
MRYFLSLIAVLAIVPFSIAQGKKTVLAIYTVPPSEGVMVDDKILPSGNQAFLEPGLHRIRTWAPNYIILDTTILVEESPVELIYYYERTEEFIEYSKRAKAHAKKRRPRVDLPMTTTTLLAGGTIFYYLRSRNLYDEAIDLHSEYLIQNSDLDFHYNEFDDKRKDYRNSMTIFYSSAALTAVSAYLLYRGIRWHKANVPKKPNDKNPFITLNTAYLSTNNTFGPTVIQASLIFNLN